MDPRRMHGLMTLWYGPFADIEPAQGYFYLCPDCYRSSVHPHVEQVQGRLAELHPAAAAHLEREAARDSRRHDDTEIPPAETNHRGPRAPEDDEAGDGDAGGDELSRSA